jgi:cytoskeletal protein CcmA (bactofilin family)
MGFFGRDDRPQTSPQNAGGQPSRPGAPPPSIPSTDRTVIADTILVEGTLSGSGQILVDGRVRGSIEGKDVVVVASRGRIDAAVHARVVMVAGRVVGNITADEKIELEPTAQVDGDMTAPRILIKDGATFRGKVNMQPPEPRGEPATSSARKDAGKPNRG